MEKQPQIFVDKTKAPVCEGCRAVRHDYRASPPDVMCGMAQAENYLKKRLGVMPTYADVAIEGVNHLHIPSACPNGYISGDNDDNLRQIR